MRSALWSMFSVSKQSIYGITPAAMEEYFRACGENPAKSAIVFDAVYRRGISRWGELPFSARVIDRLERDFDFSLPEIVSKSDSKDAAKLLLRLSDGEYVETVLMRQRYGAAVCVSSQVGCAMGCAFCRSGKLIKRRGLLPHEMTGQVLAVSREFGVSVSGVSVMGIGEPFDNFRACAEFCDILTAPKGLALGEKHVTVSTCGIVPAIYDYAALPHPCNLAISLHAPNDGLRSSFMPVNRKYPLAELIAAAERFSVTANRRVTLEYVMLSGVNDLPEHAEQLAELIGERRFYVNIIPYNPTSAGEFSPSSRERIMAFYDVLKKRGIGVTMRREFGAGLNAACGQLSSDYRGGGE